MNNKPLVLAATSLDNMAGGLERNIFYLANHMAESGRDVHVITFDLPSANAFYEFHKNVTWHKVGNSTPHMKVTFKQRLEIILSIRGIIKQLGANVPVVCFHHGLLFRFFLGTLFLKSRLICSERNSLSLYKYVRARKWNTNFLMLAVTSAITVQFPDYANDYPGWLRKKIVPIPNPVFPVDGSAQPDIPNERGRYSVLTVARLCAQKNLTHLVSAFAKIAEKNSDWDLVLVGDGPYMDKLKNLIADLHPENRVFLEGNRKNVADYYKSAHIFALPSQWEGFPNALAEALSYGLPAVSYDDCSGANSLIIHGENGLLAHENGNIDTLASALNELMSDASRRRRAGAAARESVKQYSPETVFKKWEELTG